MENESPPFEDARGGSRRNRFMKKLFNKDKADGTQQGDLDDFFQTTSADTLDVKSAVPAVPAPLSSTPSTRSRPKLNIANAARYPQAIPVQPPQQNPPPRAPPASSARRTAPSRKGLLVRFVDTWPDVIGQGGDECPEPTIEVSKRRKSQRRPAPPPPPPHRSPVLARSPVGGPGAGSPRDGMSGQSPQLLQVNSASAPDDQGTISPGNARVSRFLDPTGAKDDNRRSFIDIQQAQMREAEGRALAAAAKSGNPESATAAVHETRSEQPRSHPTGHEPFTLRTAPLITESAPAPARGQPVQSQRAHAQSPASMTSAASSNYSQSSTLDNSPPPDNSPRQGSLVAPPSATSTLSGANPYIFPPDAPSRQGSLVSQTERLMSATRQPSFRGIEDVVQAAGDDALDTFVARTKHLFELFRLHAETVRPISTSMPAPLARASLWWFLKGRMGLEMVIRSREGSDSQAQMRIEMDRQQAYANLAKGYWLSEMAIPEVLEARGLQMEPDVEDARRALQSNLRKITMSMKRNGMLPPAEAFLPQTVDKSVWVESPTLSQDIVALLTGSAGSGMTMTQRTTSPLTMVESLPLGDTNEYFNYSRIAVDAYLMEQGNESQRIALPSLLSTVRPLSQSSLSFILSTQCGQVQLRIQNNKAVGPTWEDVRWVPDANVVNVRLPRGFKLDIHCSRHDFGMLWNMYDFGKKVQATLYPRPDEVLAFQTTLTEFEYMDSDPKSRSFPQDTQRNCELALFEKIQKESIAGGTRTLHRGCRIAVITGPHTRTLSGANQTYLPINPITFAFLRGNSGLPALDLRFDDGKKRGHMILAFKDEKERLEFHKLFTGATVRNDEVVVAKVPISGFKLSQRLADAQGMAGFEKFPWSVAKVVNEENMGEEPPTVLSDHMRVWMDFNLGTITDRLNMAPGEFKFRLEVGDPKVLRILRQPQQDMTIGLSESHVPKGAMRDITQSLQVVSKTQTVRSFSFPTTKDLHQFQAALTGFNVIFDAVAATFAISRRRMVVPIHKKWEAGRTRIQIVQQDKVMQMLVFFEEFHHGHCMGFVLKGTDVFEAFGRSSKAGLKMVDAKFPLPRRGDEGHKKDVGGNPDEAAFLCLDLPEIPGEHDDITMLFESEAGELSAEVFVKMRR